MLEELRKRIQHCCATLRRSRNKRNVGSCWLKSSTSSVQTSCNDSQQHGTCNRVCKQTQHVTPNNIGSCWPTLLRPFQGQVSWPFGLNNHCNITHQKLSGKSVNDPISCLQIFKLIFVKLHGSENVGCNLLNFSETGNYAKPFFGI